MPELAHLVYFVTVVAATGAPDPTVSHRPPADRSGGKAVRVTIGAAENAVKDSASDIVDRFGAHVGQISSRASFAPHVGRASSSSAAAPRLAPAPRSVASGLSPVSEQSGASASPSPSLAPGHHRSKSAFAGREVGAGGGGGVPTASRNGGAATHVGSASAAGKLGDFGAQVAARASTRDFSHLAKQSSKKKKAPGVAAGEQPRASGGTMTLAEVLAAREAGAEGLDAEHLEVRVCFHRVQCAT